MQVGRLPLRASDDFTLTSPVQVMHVRQCVKSLARLGDLRTGAERVALSLSQFRIFAECASNVLRKGIMNVMRSVKHTTRCLLTAGLIVGLVLTGIFPPMAAWAGRGSRAAEPEKRAKCCCGTEDGRCCGMGCCLAREAPAQQPSPSPNPKDSRDGVNNPLALAFAQAILKNVDGSSRSRFTRAESGNSAPVDSSLQAKHVRIDA